MYNFYVKVVALVCLYVCTHKVVALVGMSQYIVAHLMKDVGDKIERQRGRHL